MIHRRSGGRVPLVAAAVAPVAREGAVLPPESIVADLHQFEQTVGLIRETTDTVVSSSPAETRNMFGSRNHHG